MLHNGPSICAIRSALGPRVERALEEATSIRAPFSESDKDGYLQYKLPVAVQDNFLLDSAVLSERSGLLQYGDGFRGPVRVYTLLEASRCPRDLHVVQNAGSLHLCCCQFRCTRLPDLCGKLPLPLCELQRVLQVSTSAVTGSLLTS